MNKEQMEKLSTALYILAVCNEFELEIGSIQTEILSPLSSMVLLFRSGKNFEKRFEKLAERLKCKIEEEETQRFINFNDFKIFYVKEC